jgi:D-arginine dehydrogenase
MSTRTTRGPDDEALAGGVERMQAATTLTVERRPIAWAGLRTFPPDRRPVVGFDPAAPGLFQLVGQGGYGVQTAAAVSRLAADLIAGRAPSLDVDAALYNPARFRRGVA